MMNYYLSLCIPTNGRIEILRKTLDSIFADNDVDYADFEVVLSDNSTSSDLENLLSEYKNYPNISFEMTACKGFQNSVNALKMGKGAFLKLHNDYTILNGNSLSRMISFIKSQMASKPLVFFTNGELNRQSIIEYKNFDDFAHELSFWNTWSTGFSIWKQDFDLHANKHLDVVFPHTTLLLLQNQKKSFVINDSKLFFNQVVKKKGGYNLFKSFSVDYLKMLEDKMKLGHISLNTFNKIKHDLYYKFLVDWYYQTNIASNLYTYDLTDIKASISVYYSKSYYYKMIRLGYLMHFNRIKGYLLRKLKLS